MSDRPALTVAEAADLLGIAPSTAYDLIRSGGFPVPVLHIGAGRRGMRISRARLLAWIDQEEVA